MRSPPLLISFAPAIAAATFAACASPRAAPATPMTTPAPTAAPAPASSAPATTAAPSTTPPPPAPPAAKPAAAAELAKDAELLPPGCTDAETTARRAEIDALHGLIHAEPADPRAVLDELRAMLARPCLRHAAAALPLPDATTADELRDIWGHALYGGLEEMTALQRKNGSLHLVLPREITPAPDAATRARLARFWCQGGEAACDRAASYITRAEQVFDAQIQQVHAGMHPHPVISFGTTFTELPARACDGTSQYIPKPTTFQEWVSCVAARAPRGLRYAAGARFRNLDRGWLVLRGRRGHYDFADEVRAYDLATGAAYVVRDPGGLIAIAERPPPPSEAYTGSVAPDQLRELTFALVTRPALVEVRATNLYAVIPETLPLPLAAPGAPLPDPPSWGRFSVSTSDQTTIDFTYFDGALREVGSFTWPQTYDGIDTYVDDLIRVMEAGLVRGCAPARLPSLFALRGTRGGVSAIDASPGQLAATHASLDQRLEDLRPRACRGAR